MPYLPIDPKDVGREYESDVIRINSQSGKGGIAFVLKENFGISLPDGMKEEVGYLMKGVSDERHQELSPTDIYDIFEETYIYPRSVFDIPECHFRQTDGIRASVTIEQEKGRKEIEAQGNGRLDAVSCAVKLAFGISYQLAVYEEHAVSRGSSSRAAAFVGVLYEGRMYWGVGMDEDTLNHILEYQAAGYGVKNVNDRMILHYGEAYGIRIHSAPGEWTAVLLTFPRGQKEKM